jgi:hypothetical protein
MTRARYACAVGVLIGAFAAMPAMAALSCEQIFAITQAAVKYRDQGYSLKQVLAALKDVEAENKLTAAEMTALTNAVTATYLGQLSPEEVALECIKVRDQKR